MKYPVLSYDKLTAKIDDLLSGDIADLRDDADWIGEGPALELQPLQNAIDEIRDALQTRLQDTEPELDDDQFEGEQASRLYETLREMDLQILDDPGFWAYLAAGPLWFFVKWRENPELRSRTRYTLYLDGSANAECVPLRMYLRARAVDDNGDTSLAAAIEKGVDFWRSHIIRVRTGSEPDLARAIVRQQRDARLTVRPLREFAKRINRRWSNEVLYVLDSGECAEIADAEREA